MMYQYATVFAVTSRQSIVTISELRLADNQASANKLDAPRRIYRKVG